MKRAGLVVAYGLMGIVLAGCPKDKKKSPPGANGSSIKWSIADVSVDESDGTAKLTVSLSAAALAGMTVKYSTSDGSATAPGDYESASSETLTIPEGKSSAKISIPLVDDPSVEGHESFNVTLSAPSKGTLDKASAVVTLIDDTGANGAGGEGGMGTGSGGTGASGGTSGDGGADSTGGTDSTGDGGESASGGTQSSGGKGGTSSGGKGGTGSGGSSGNAATGGVGGSGSNNDTGNLYLQSYSNAITVCQLAYCGSAANLFFYPQGGDSNDTLAIADFVISNDRTKIAAFGVRSHVDENDATQNFDQPVVFIGTIPEYLTKTTSSTDLGLKELAVEGHHSVFFGPEYATDVDVGVWSPDNQHVAFIARPYVDDDVGYAPVATDALYIADADGNYLERVPLPAKDSVSYAEKNIHWSADSTALGFLAQRAEPGPEYFIDAFTWTKAGGLKSYPQDFLNSADGMLPRPGSGHDYVYGFDGTIYVVAAGSTTPTPLTQTTETASHPRWSPDGLHIAFWATADGETASNIWVMDDDGGNRHQVTFGGSAAGKPFAYSPDGSLIAYTSDEEAAGHPRLYQINGDAPTVAKRKQLSPNADTIAGVSNWDPVWSQDGAYVAYGWYDETNHYRIQIATADDAQSGVTVSPADHDVIVDGAPIEPWLGTYRPLKPCWSSSTYNQLGFAAISDNGMFQNVYRVKADGSALLQMYGEGPDIPAEPFTVGWLTWDVGDNLAAPVWIGLHRYYRVWAGDPSNTIRFSGPSGVPGGSWGVVH